MRAAMTRDDVIQRARAATEAEGWPWREPIQVQRVRQGLVAGRVTWHVMTNAAYRGGNVNIWIDDQSGAVVKQGFAPR